jgi:hypothetical protein
LLGLLFSCVAHGCNVLFVVLVPTEFSMCCCALTRPPPPPLRSVKLGVFSDGTSIDEAPAKKTPSLQNLDCDCVVALSWPACCAFLEYLFFTVIERQSALYCGKLAGPEGPRRRLHAMLYLLGL